MIRSPLTAVLFFGFLTSVLTQCTVAPRPGEKEISSALPAPGVGPLAVASRSLSRQRARGHSSFLLLEGAKEALDWRLALIDSARSSIDIQVYLWHDGASSRLLLDRVLQAADRGVRVRILVDDFLFSEDEALIASLCRHQENFEVRIFNPTRLRGTALGSAAEFLMDFQRLNRRMHNKTWTVDRSFAIVGGRNVGNHYFGLDPDYNFLDLDVLTAGPVVADVSAGFDLYWNAPQSCPAEFLSRRADPERVPEMKRQLAGYIATERSDQLRSFSTAPRDWSRELRRLPQTMATGRARFLQDHPDVEEDHRQVVTKLNQTIDKSEKLILVSAYLLPSNEGLARLEAGTRAGGQARFLAPTLSANNQALAHGHYKKKRKQILAKGGRLYEMKHNPSAALRNLADVEPVRCREVCLHVKALVGERRHCYIGSVNVDPRAVKINTESGMLIDSPQLTGELHDFLEGVLAEDCWELRLDERGRLTWISGDQILRKEPPARFSKRALSFLSGLLPIESQL